MMKNYILLLCLAALTQTVGAQNADKVMVTGCRFDIEAFKNPINLKQNINDLNLEETRILRNAFAAQKGVCLMEGDLRAVFSKTSWYDERAEEADANSTEPDYTSAETAFMQKLEAREKMLKAQNFKTSAGGRVNVRNIINPFQLEAFDQPMQTMLERNGFAIVPRQNIQLFHAYENNDYHDFPSFVTTDMYMQLFHLYFSYMLRSLEEEKLIPLLKQFSRKMYDESMQIAATATLPQLKDAAEYEAVYYAIGYALLTNVTELPLPASYKKYFGEEMKRVADATDDFSPFLGYEDTYFPYSLFRPRGHYTRTARLKHYFAAMMWFQYVPYCLDNETQLQRAILQADILNRQPELMQRYKSLVEPITFIIGETDNVSILQLAETMKAGNYSLAALMSRTPQYTEFCTKIKKMAAAQNRISPKVETTCRDKINLMPQRYLPDNEVLQELVDVKTQPVSLRAYPKGLDVMAAFGSASAENILLDELKEGEKWPRYMPILGEMKGKMADVNWNASMYNKWMQSLNALQQRDDRYPYFMQTPQWDKKNLNAALASWAELKHDAILYAEQPMAAECGGGDGLPDPVVVAYVEPNTAYWQKLLELIDLTEKMLKRNNLLTEKLGKNAIQLREQTEFLLNASKKELAGEMLNEQEYSTIEHIGAAVEWLTLDFVRQGDQSISGWDNVQGPDKSVAVVADVYTANAPNNPSQGILHEAVGNVDDIYVVVEIGGYLYLTRGAVFSYREFPMPMGTRLTDEEWQEKLKSAPNFGVPAWMNEILLKDNVPNDNEELFYSSGC